MSNLSFEQLAQLAQSVGLPQSKAAIAAAIALAESGGDPNQVTQDNDDDSYGLWQINMIGSLGPDRRRVYGLKSNSDLLNPATNARVMSAMSHQGQNFNPWTTYTSGKYKTFLQQYAGSSSKNSTLKTIVGGILAAGGGVYGAEAAGGAVDAAGQVISDTAQIVEFLGTAELALVRGGAWVANPKNWVRVLYVAGGAAAVLWGVNAIIGSTQTGSAVVGSAKNAARKTGKAAVTAATTLVAPEASVPAMGVRGAAGVGRSAARTSKTWFGPNAASA